MKAGPTSRNIDDRTGKVRRYLRRRGKPTYSPPRSFPARGQFLAAYEAGLAITEKHKGESTLMGRSARCHTDSTNRQHSTIWPRHRNSAIGWCWISSPREDGHRLARDMPRRVAISVIEEIGETTPGMANLSASVLRRLFAYAIKKELRTDNPFAGIEPYKLGTHHTWTEAEITTYRAKWPLGTRERLAHTIYCSTPGNVLATLQRCARPIYATP